MSKTFKIIVGALSFWPLAYMFLFFVFVFGSFLLPIIAVGMSGGGEPDPAFAIAPFVGFGLVFVLHGLTILLSFALSAFYIYQFFRDETLDDTKTLLWSVFIFFGNMIAFPVAWYVHIWTEGEGFEQLTGGEESAST